MANSQSESPESRASEQRAPEPRSPEPPHPQWALSAIVSERFLNGLAEAGIGDGVDVTPFSKTFQLPMMGPMALQISMTITGVSFRLTPEHGGRLLATIEAAGTVDALGENAMPVLPGKARVKGDVLVDAVIELRDDHSFVAVLDALGAELVSVELLGIDGIEADEEAQRQMGEMMFAALGGELFEALAHELGSVGLELEPDRGIAFHELGVAPGPADLYLYDETLVVGLPAVAELEGSAKPIAVEGTKLGIGVASGSLAVLVDRLAREALGTGLPFDLHVESSRRRIDTNLRNLRLLESDALPDLRPGFRLTIRPELVGDHIEFAVREAWLELPLVPDFVNSFNRFMGGAASYAPLSVRLPATVSMPVRPESDSRIDASVVAIDVEDDGVHVTVDAHL